MKLRSNELELLLAVLEARTTIGAARTMGVDQSTVSRRLSALEARLGVELFVRAGRGLVPTPLAERLEASATQVVRGLRHAEQLLSVDAESPAGVVRIAVPEGFCSYILIPQLAEFLDAHPSLEVSISAGPELVDLASAEAHLAVRLQRPTSGDVVSKLLERDTLGVFGTRRQIEGRSFAEYRWIGWEERYEHLEEAQLLFRALGRAPQLRMSSFTSMLEASRAGAGVVLLGRKFGAALGLTEGDSGPLAKIQTRLYLAAPRALRRTPPVAACWAWIQACLQQALEQAVP